MSPRQQRPFGGQFEDLVARLEETERRIECLETTLNAVAREAGNVSVRHTCSACKSCHLLDKDGVLYCPNCGNQQSV